MHTTRSVVAVLALASGTVALASGEAFARDPDKEMPVERPAAAVWHAPSPLDDTRVEVVQSGASALGGAGVACGVIWLYRRRDRVAERV